MPSVRLPLSGDVTQTIDPFNWSSRGGQFAFFNIDLGSSADPAAERDIIAEIGSYGRQIGRLGDALAVLLKHVDTSKFSAEDWMAVGALKTQLESVERSKKKKRP